MTAALRVKRLSKRYFLDDEPRERYQTLRDSIARAASHGWRWVRGRQKDGAEPRRERRTIWALRNASFEVARGEVVGVVGRNGAGKSTLLKILSRITEPTAGRAEIHGTVGSLLEVGTGFHPELTGRENIYLGGAMLGLSKRMIDARFDEIVSFSAVPKFLDVPVKRYSSGMQLRLAFAVAAHLEPSVLIIDEVLAVGDAAFQQKCLGKIREVAHHGRTVLFVSHNLAAVQGLCRRALYLAEGRIVDDGPATTVVSRYLQDTNELARIRLRDRTDRGGRGRCRLLDLEVLGEDGAGHLRVGESARFRFHVSAPLSGLACQFTIFDQYGVHLAACRTENAGPADSRDPGLATMFECVIHPCLLLPGPYRLNVVLTTPAGIEDQVDTAALFHVHAGVVDGRLVDDGIQYGRVHFPHRWRVPVAPAE